MKHISTTFLIMFVATGKAESEFWTILLAWEKDEQGARIKDLIQRYTKVSPSGKSCLHQVEEASQLAILQIASKILPGTQPSSISFPFQIFLSLLANNSK